MIMPYQELIARGVPKSRMMDTVGDGSGSIDMRQNGSLGTPVEFFLTVPPGHIYLMISVEAIVVDSPISATGFGGGAVLTNGVDFGITIDSVFTSFIAQQPIQSNADWAAIGATVHTLIAAATDSLTARLRFLESYGGYRKLNAGDKYTVRVQDNLTTYGDKIAVHIGYLDITEGELVS